MTDAPPDDPPAEPAGSLEIRWIFPGEPDTAIARWFMRFPAETRTFEDIYLLDPHLPALSVKLRSRQALEVKAYHGAPRSSTWLAAAAARCSPGRNGRFPSAPTARPQLRPTADPRT